MEGIPVRNTTQLQKGSIATTQLSPTRPLPPKVYTTLVSCHAINYMGRPEAFVHASSTFSPGCIASITTPLLNTVQSFIGLQCPHLPRYVVTSYNFLSGGGNLIRHDTSYILQPISNIRILHPTSRVGKWFNCFTVHSAYIFHRTS